MFISELILLVDNIVYLFVESQQVAVHEPGALARVKRLFEVSSHRYGQQVTLAFVRFEVRPSWDPSTRLAFFLLFRTSIGYLYAAGLRLIAAVPLRAAPGFLV